VGGEAGGVGDVSPGSLDLDIRHDGGKRKTTTKKGGGGGGRSGSVTAQS
jgi:hypothetical protein